MVFKSFRLARSFRKPLYVVSFYFCVCRFNYPPGSDVKRSKAGLIHIFRFHVVYNLKRNETYACSLPPRQKKTIKKNLKEEGSILPPDFFEGSPWLVAVGLEPMVRQKGMVTGFRENERNWGQDMPYKDRPLASHFFLLDLSPTPNSPAMRASVE